MNFYFLVNYSFNYRHKEDDETLGKYGFHLLRSTVVTLNTTPLSHRIMKSLWEKGQFPMLSPSLPALNKHTEQVRSRLTIDMFCSWTLITNNGTLQRGWNHPTLSGCSNETQGSLQWFEQRWPCTDQQGHKIPAEVRDTPALLQNGSVSHYGDTGPGLAHLTQWLFHAHSSLLWRRYSSTTERASWTPAPNTPALPLPSWTEPVFQSKRKLLRRLRLSSPLTFSFVGMHKQERWRWEHDQKGWHVYYELTAGTLTMTTGPNVERI